jgi:hypothetical protein
MKFISHRGNIDGILQDSTERENSPAYIDEAIDGGFDVEVDIRLINGYVPPGDFYLGHDHPKYEVTLDWLIERKNSLWLHAKNVDALGWFLNSNIGWNTFWHQEDNYTITSNGYIWVYPGKLPCKGSIIVMPEKTDYKWKTMRRCAGICSDNIGKYRDEYFKNT